MNGFSFDNLSPVKFEEFCYELLVRLGGQDVNWRRGTGLNSSPSDQGRDIECHFIKNDPDGSQRRERWFVECKHYKEGVPPTKIEAGLAWARAERPDVLLIIASNAFSNPCKEYLRRYQDTDRPPFRIKLWEIKELESFTVSAPDLLRKYGLTDDFPFLQLLHPLHVLFIREPPLNTLQYFFDILEKAGPHRFRDALSLISLMVVNPQVKFPTDPHETLGDLIQTNTGYVALRKKCFELAGSVQGSFLVRAIVNEMLIAAFQSGDKTRLGRVLENNELLLKSIQANQSAGTSKGAGDTLHEIQEIKALLAELPMRMDQSYKLYTALCEEIVGPLFQEPVRFPPEVLSFMEKVTGTKIFGS